MHRWIRITEQDSIMTIDVLEPTAPLQFDVIMRTTFTLDYIRSNPAELGITLYQFTTQYLRG